MSVRKEKLIKIGHDTGELEPGEAVMMVIKIDDIYREISGSCQVVASTDPEEAGGDSYWPVTTYAVEMREYGPVVTDNRKQLAKGQLVVKIGKIVSGGEALNKELNKYRKNIAQTPEIS